MHIYGNVLIRDIDGVDYFGHVLVADVFENNNSFKVAIVIDFNSILPDEFLNNTNIDFIVLTIDVMGKQFYSYINVERNNEEIEDTYFDEDYRNGSVSRLYVICENGDCGILMDSNFALIENPLMVNNEIKKAFEDNRIKDNKIMKQYL